MLKKDDKNQQLAYYQVGHREAPFWDLIMQLIHMVS